VRRRAAIFVTRLPSRSAAVCTALCTVSRTLCDQSQMPDPAFTAVRCLRYNRDMRSRKYRVVTTLERASNRLMRLALRAGLAPRAFALLETTGRRTGLARHTPLGNGLDGDTFWLVAAHGAQADYVRNLQAEPRVRVKAGGVWRAGTAVVLPGDDPAARSRMLPHQWDAAIGRMMASAPLTIRIDLDPRPEPK
jgi:deazaflavin-dependent oxidoreductase (nitroreductase family)